MGMAMFRGMSTGAKHTEERKQQMLSWGCTHMKDVLMFQE